MHHTKGLLHCIVYSRDKALSLTCLNTEAQTEVLNIDLYHYIHKRYSVCLLFVQIITAGQIALKFYMEVANTLVYTCRPFIPKQHLFPKDDRI